MSEEVLPSPKSHAQLVAPVLKSVKDATSKLLVEENAAAGSGDIVTVNVWAGDVPHALPAVTVIVPPIAPAIVEIEFVPLVPDHPLGNVQV